MNYPTLTKEKPDCVLLCVPQAGIFPIEVLRLCTMRSLRIDGKMIQKEAIPRNKEWLLRLVITSIGAIFALRAKGRCYPSSMSGD